MSRVSIAVRVQQFDITCFMWSFFCFAIQNGLIYKRICVLKYGAAKDPTWATTLQIRTTKNSQAVGRVQLKCDGTR